MNKTKLHCAGMENSREGFENFNDFRVVGY